MFSSDRFRPSVLLSVATASPAASAAAGATFVVLVNVTVSALWGENDGNKKRIEYQFA